MRQIIGLDFTGILYKSPESLYFPGMDASHIELVASTLFGLAILHTFSVKRFQHWAHQCKDGSVGENLFHLLGEVEVVFGLWAGLLIVYMAFTEGGEYAIHFLDGTNFTEPAFVFVIMTIAATRPVIDLATFVIAAVARLLPMDKNMAFYWSALVIGPLLGSFITEPAAMTVTALILKDRIFDKGTSRNFMYLTLGVLFVNISIGGVLTNFAAPPVLMVASTWNWDIAFMFMHFGWKAAIAVVINASIATVYGIKVFQYLKSIDTEVKSENAFSPFAMIAIHVAFLAFVVMTSHHPIVFLGGFLFFMGVVAVTNEYQDELKLKESLLVGFFLGGLVVMGSLQSWWLKPLLASLGTTPLYLGATALTAFTDNAALTFLGAQVPGISDAMKYALVAGAVTGGGLTVIANAPNPAGFSILRNSFGEEGISPLGLAAGAAIPTLVALACLWLLPYSL